MKNLFIIILVIAVLGFYAKDKLSNTGFRMLHDSDESFIWQCGANYGADDKRSFMNLGLDFSESKDLNIKNNIALTFSIGKTLGALFGGPGVAFYSDDQEIYNDVLITIRSEEYSTDKYVMPYTSLSMENKQIYNESIELCLNGDKDKINIKAHELLMSVLGSENWKNYEIQ